MIEGPVVDEGTQLKQLIVKIVEGVVGKRERSELDTDAIADVVADVLDGMDLTDNIDERLSDVERQVEYDLISEDSVRDIAREEAEEALRENSDSDLESRIDELESQIQELTNRIDNASLDI